MNFIKIESLENGAHENRNYPWEETVPEGWALIPEGMKVPDTYPFVSVRAEEVDGVMTVTEMTAGTMPDPVPPEPTIPEQVAALQEQNKKLAEQNEMLTQCLLEMSETVYA